MRIHLRHTRTGQLFQSPSTWTDDLEMAYDFRFPERAEQFAAAWEITDVELCLEFDATPPVAEESIIVPFTTEAPLPKAA